MTSRVVAIGLVIGLAGGCAETKLNKARCWGGTHGTFKCVSSIWHTKAVRIYVAERYATRLCSGSNLEMKIIDDSLKYEGWGR